MNQKSAIQLLNSSQQDLLSYKAGIILLHFTQSQRIKDQSRQMLAMKCYMVLMSLSRPPVYDLMFPLCEDEGTRAWQHEIKKKPKEDEEQYEWSCMIIQCKIFLN